MKSRNDGLDVAQQALPGAKWRKGTYGYSCYAGGLLVECLEAANDWQLYATEADGNGTQYDAMNPGPFRKFMRKRLETLRKQALEIETGLGE